MTDQENISTEGRADMQVAIWGNSLAVRLPAAAVKLLGLKEGDEIEIQVADFAIRDDL